MPSRRKFFMRVGGAVSLGVLTGSAGCLRTTRTKFGGGSTRTIDFESPTSETFVSPSEVPPYIDRMRERYEDVAVPWMKPRSLPGNLVGMYTRQEAIIPSNRYAVQDAAVLVHHLVDTRYRLRLWSAGRLLRRTYGDDSWEIYQKKMAFTQLEQELEVNYENQLSTDRSFSGDGGSVNVAGETMIVPDGSYEMGLIDETRYHSHWNGFHANDVPLIGVCEVSFADSAERRLDWTLDYGIGVRTPV